MRVHTVYCTRFPFRVLCGAVIVHRGRSECLYCCSLHSPMTFLRGGAGYLWVHYISTSVLLFGNRSNLPSHMAGLDLVSLRPPIRAHYTYRPFEHPQSCPYCTPSVPLVPHTGAPFLHFAAGLSPGRSVTCCHLADRFHTTRTCRRPRASWWRGSTARWRRWRTSRTRSTATWARWSGRTSPCGERCSCSDRNTPNNSRSSTRFVTQIGTH